MWELNIVVNYPDDTDYETTFNYDTIKALTENLELFIIKNPEASSFVFVVTPSSR